MGSKPLDTVMHQGQLDEAEKMYQRALQGYEKSLDLEDVASDVIGLDKKNSICPKFIQNLSSDP